MHMAGGDSAVLEFHALPNLEPNAGGKGRGEREREREREREINLIQYVHDHLLIIAFRDHAD